MDGYRSQLKGLHVLYVKKKVVPGGRVADLEDLLDRPLSPDLRLLSATPLSVSLDEGLMVNVWYS